MTIRKLLNEIEVCKTKIAKERDKLRDIVGVLNNLLSSFDEGIYNLENGIEDIKDGIADISEVV